MELLQFNGRNINRTGVFSLELAKRSTQYLSIFSAKKLRDIRKKINKWAFQRQLRFFVNFLKNHQQAVKFTNIISEWQILYHRVPQDTILGPKIFILYFNEFSFNFLKIKVELINLQMKPV